MRASVSVPECELGFDEGEKFAEQSHVCCDAGESDAACLERAMNALSSGFVPAASWLGHQPGYAFKCSDFGLGYYPDMPGDTNTSTATAARPDATSLEAEQVAWQFAEGCEVQLRGTNGVGGLPGELSESAEALLKVSHVVRR